MIGEIIPESCIHLCEEPEKEAFSYFVAFQKFRTTLYRETLNSAAIDQFRHTCRSILDEERVHEYVRVNSSEESSSVEVPLQEAERLIRDMADGSIKLEQTGTGWALAGALEAGQQLTPMLARIRWTLLEAPTSEPWMTTDNPVALFEPFPVRSKREIYGPSLQFFFPISPRFLLSGDPMTRGADDRGRVSVKTVRKMTDELLRIAHRQVYASFFSKELQGLFTRLCSERESLVVPMPANYRGAGSR